MFVYTKNSPTDLAFESKQPSLNLHSVSRSLEVNPRPRDYSPTWRVSDSSDSGSPTPPPHELHRLRALCHEFGDEERRDSVPEWTYWRTEAEFYAGKVEGGEVERQSLHDSDYWKVEARFWKANCLSSNSHANRHELADLRYWRRESNFWKSYYKGKTRLSPSHLRQEINWAPYWRTEYSHVRDLFQASARPDESCARTAPPMHPPSPHAPNPSSVSDSASLVNPRVIQFASVSPRPTRPRHFPSRSAGKPRRSKRLQAKQRQMKQATETATGTISPGSASVKESRMGQSGANRGGSLRRRITRGVKRS